MKVHTYCKINITLYDYMLTECRCGEYNIKAHFYNHNHLLLFISCSHWDESQVTFTYWITKLKLMMGSIMPHTELCTLEWLWESRRVKKEKKHIHSAQWLQDYSERQAGNTGTVRDLRLSKKAGSLGINFAENFWASLFVQSCNTLLMYYCI